MHIGEKIRNLRKSKKMKLIELASKSGVQIATLSRIEHGKMTGTLDSHMQIAQALGTDITELYRDMSPNTIGVDIQKQTQSSEIFVHSDQSSYEILTQNILKKQMMPTRVKIEAHGRTNIEQHKPGCEKFIYVLEGKLEILINDQTYPLSKNNSLYFDASLKHQFINQGDKPASMLCIVTPVEL